MTTPTSTPTTTSTLNDAARAALTAGRLAHLVTLDEDGSPHVTLVWVGLDGDTLVTAHLGRYRKIRNVQRDARIALSVEVAGSEGRGLEHYLVVHGRAEVVEGGAVEVLERLAPRYLGPEVPAVPPATGADGPPPGYVLRITAERITGIGPW